MGCGCLKACTRKRPTLEHLDPVARGQAPVLQDAFIILTVDTGDLSVCDYMRSQTIDGWQRASLCTRTALLVYLYPPTPKQCTRTIIRVQNLNVGILHGMQDDNRCASTDLADSTERASATHCTVQTRHVSLNISTDVSCFPAGYAEHGDFGMQALRTKIEQIHEK